VLQLCVIVIAYEEIISVIVTSVTSTIQSSLGLCSDMLMVSLRQSKVL